MEYNNKGWRRIILATDCSVKGLRAAWKNEAAFRQECIACFLLFPVALYLDITVIEKLLLLGSCILVLVAELLNSALEAVVDRVGLEHHELSGRAKDMGSAAVFVAMLWVMMVWSVVIYGRYFLV